jgi:hypothetical protein
MSGKIRQYKGFTIEKCVAWSGITHNPMDHMARIERTDCSYWRITKDGKLADSALSLRTARKRVDKLAWAAVGQAISDVLTSHIIPEGEMRHRLRIEMRHRLRM